MNSIIIKQLDLQVCELAWHMKTNIYCAANSRHILSPFSSQFSGQGTIHCNTKISFLIFKKKQDSSHKGIVPVFFKYLHIPQLCVLSDKIIQKVFLQMENSALNIQSQFLLLEEQYNTCSAVLYCEYRCTQGSYIRKWWRKECRAINLTRVHNAEAHSEISGCGSHFSIWTTNFWIEFKKVESYFYFVHRKIQL